MPQKDFDTLTKLTDSRYQLSMVVSERAAQLKYGVVSTATGRALHREKNAVSAAMEELVVGSGVRWGDDLPDQATILQIAQNENWERRDKQEGGFTVTNGGDLPGIPLRGAYRDRY